jgi:hypothetical protein
MVTPKEKEVEKKELPKIIAKAPEAEMRLKVIPKPVKVREEAKEAMTEAEKNATKVAQSFIDFYTAALNRTPKGREFLANIKKNSQIGNLLFV